MKPSEIAKNHGLKGLKEIEELTGISRQTLIKWHKDRPRLFDVIVKGSINVKKEDVK